MRYNHYWLGSVIWAGYALLPVAQAGDFAIDWFTIDGGGGTSTGGSFELSGTFGQADASSTIAAGGEYDCAGGFWLAAQAVCLADQNGDGMFDLGDFARFEPCLLGPELTAETTCACFDFDGDNDVDLGDYAEMVRAFDTD